MPACRQGDACGAADAGATPDSGTKPDSGVTADAGDPQCDARPVMLDVHPWAAMQRSDMGKNLRNVRGFHGRVYFGYGDLNENTGPIVIASYDPAAKSWANHLTFDTESVERFVEIGGELWATSSDGHTAFPGTDDYATGSANHIWVAHEVDWTIHMMDVTERVPGEVLLGGSALLDAGVPYGAVIWRSVGGAPFTRIFPGAGGSGETSGGPFQSLATLRGVTYAVSGHSVWTWSGTAWRHARTPTDDVHPVLLDGFVNPVTFADHLVFASFGGDLWKFDGTYTKRVGIRTIDTPTSLGFTEAPVAIFELSEGRLLAVNENGDVLMTTDLSTFTCIGKAPTDVRGIGSLDGVVYFGGAAGRVYAYDHRSW